MVLTEASRKRAHTTGSITKLANGRLWVRAARQPDGSRPSLGYAANDDEAQALLALNQRKGGKKEGTPVWADWVDKVLDIRESDGIRGMRQDRSRRLHLKSAHFARTPIDKITAADILEWIRKLKRTLAADRRGKRFLDHDTICRCVSLASAIFTEAIGTHIDANPCVGVPIKNDAKVDEDEDREEVWDWLRLEDQEKFKACDAIPEWFRLLVMFAWGCGLRQGEQWHLKWKDVHDDAAKPYVFVRVGSKGKRPKSGKTRRVKLFGDALYAIRRWRQIIDTYLTDPRTGKKYANDRDLVWPTPRGCTRPSGAPEKSVRLPGKGRVLRDADGMNKGRSAVGKVELLELYMKLAGITRPIRWHDLRHTFCSSLASGIWGVAWTLEEICDAAGHCSVTVTEKYAHLCETVQDRAIERMGYGLVAATGTNGGSGSSVAAISSDFDALELVGRAGHDPATYGLKGQGVLELLRALQRENAPHNPTVTHLAAALAAALNS